jgi:hypothetical protein
VKAITGVTCTGSTAYTDVRYTCDTEGGSSGAPVLARSNHQVIALHHCSASNCYGNLGVPVRQFYNKVAPYLYSVAPVPAPTAAPVAPPTNPCGAGQAQFQLDLLTDRYPRETTWTVTDVRNIVQASGSGYTSSNFLYKESRCLNSLEYYKFTIFDAWGDGICCAYGNGAYTVKYNGIVVSSGGAFGKSSQSSFFGIVQDSAARTCEDDASWKYRNNKDCAWIGGKRSHACDFVGADGRLAKEACPVTCSTCPL